MRREDIKVFSEIQTRLYEYCRNIMNTLANRYPEVAIDELASVTSIGVIGDYLKMTYSSYPIDRPLFIPLQYVEAEDVDGFCKILAEKVRKYGKMMRKDELIERAYHEQWMKFYELFDVRMSDSEADLDKARNKLHSLIEAMVFVLACSKHQEDEDRRAEIFTEKELPLLNEALVQFLEWARADKFWSKKEKSDKVRAKEVKAELIATQKEIIKFIKESEYHTDNDLQLAKKVLEDIKRVV